LLSNDLLDDYDENYVYAGKRRKKVPCKKTFHMKYQFFLLKNTRSENERL
jgi:hypothetical protein